MEETLTIEELLSHQGWVRRLARGLVADPGRADDVAQETWLTAVRRPPARSTAPAAWLARVVRSRALDLFRSESRRADRERLAARPEARLGADTLVEEAELHRLLAEAVCDLPPTGREVVLLHYYHGLTRREVAARLGVPLETVRTRLRRALAELRGKLDRRRGGRLALIGGGFLMAAKTKIAIGVAAAVLVVGGTWHLVTRDESVAEPPPVVEEPAPAPLETAEAPQGEAPAAPATATATAAATAKKELNPPGVLTGRVRLADGRSAEGTVIALSWISKWVPGEELERTVTRIEAGPDGGFRFAGIEPGTCHLRFMRAGYGTEERSVSMSAEEGTAPLRIVMEEAGRLLVRVRGPEGQLLARQELKILGPRPELEVLKSTDKMGEARLDDLVPGTWEVLPQGPADGVSTSGGRDRGKGRKVEIVSGKTAEMVIDLGLATATGTVLLPDGKPMVEGFVYLIRRRPKYLRLSTRTDAEGRFRVESSVDGEFEVSIQALTPIRFVCPAGTVKLVMGEVVARSLTIRDTKISGRLVRADDGEPVAKASLDARCGGLSASAFPAPDGTWSFVGLPPGAWKIRVYPHDRRLARPTREVVLPDSGRLEGVDFTLEGRPVGVLRLRVLDDKGAGIERVQVSVYTGSSVGTFPAKHVGGGVQEIVLEPGKHTVEVAVAGFHIERVPVEIAEGETIDREVKLTPFRR